MTSLRCTAAGPCDFHRDRGPATERCPWYCAEGISIQVYVVVTDAAAGAAHPSYQLPGARA